MIAHSDEFYRTLKKKKPENHQTLHFPESLAFSISPFATWSRTVNFSKHLPVSEWNTVSLHGWTSGSCIENLAAHPWSQHGGQRVSELWSAGQGWHSASIQLSSHNCWVPKASSHIPFQEHPGKAPTFLFFFLTRKNFKRVHKLLFWRPHSDTLTMFQLSLRFLLSGIMFGLSL